MANYYEILGVAEQAEPEGIHSAFKKLALIHHPDKEGNVDTFKTIVNARDVLLDPQKRIEYDKILKIKRRDSLSNPHHNQNFRGTLLGGLEERLQYLLETCPDSQLDNMIFNADWGGRLFAQNNFYSINDIHPSTMRILLNVGTRDRGISDKIMSQTAFLAAKNGNIAILNLFLSTPNKSSAAKATIIEEAFIGATEGNHLTLAVNLLKEYPSKKINDFVINTCTYHLYNGKDITKKSITEIKIILSTFPKKYIQAAITADDYALFSLAVDESIKSCESRILNHLYEACEPSQREEMLKKVCTSQNEATIRTMLSIGQPSANMGAQPAANVESVEVHYRTLLKKIRAEDRPLGGYLKPS